MTTRGYSSLSNKLAAQFTNSFKKSNLHTLIPSCKFINFGKISGKMIFIVVIFGKFQPSQPYSALHV